MIRTALLCFACFVSSFSVIAQQKIQRDPQAIAMVSQALAAGGGQAAISAIQDYTGTGQITYYWADQDVKGSVTVRGRGMTDFRIDAQLPQGPRTSVFTKTISSLKGIDGSIRVLGEEHSSDVGTVDLPLLELAVALEDQSVSITDLGLVTRDGRQEHGIRVQKIFPTSGSQHSFRSKESQKDFFFDPATFFLARTADTVHPDNNPDRPVPREIIYSNYQQVSGVLVPFSVTQTIYRQRTFLIELQKVTFNSGLADSDFQLQ